MKDLSKLVFLFFLIISCSSEEKGEIKLSRLIHADTELIITTPDFSELQQTLNANAFLNISSSALKKKIQKQLNFLDKLALKREILFTFSNLENQTLTYTISTRKDSSFFQLDSLQDKKVENFNENGVYFKRFTLGNSKFLVTEIGDYYIISNSRDKLTQISKGENLLEYSEFKKVFEARDPAKTSVIFRKDLKLPELDNFLESFGQFNFKNLANWTVLDLDLEDNQFKINGITINSEQKNFQDVLRDQEATPSKNINIIPSSFISFSTVNYSDYQVFDSQRNSYISDSIPSINNLFNFSSEISKTEIPDGTAFSVGLDDLELGIESLTEIAAENLNFRGVSIFRVNDSEEIAQKFKPFFNAENLAYACVINHSAVFSKEISVLENMISANLNSSLLSHQTYFKDFINQLASESSMLILAKTTNFNKAVFNKENSGFEQNSLFAIQFITEDNFTHIHGIFSAESKNSEQIQAVAQSGSIKIEKTISGKFQFFRNHQTGQLDVVVQDKDNMLYLLSNKGSIFWKKQLESKISGSIHEIDLFKNANKQLAFTTSHELQVIDRQGKTVKPFPNKFNDTFTQPLSVFDYDNNRTYRFVLTQHSKVYMLDPNGKSIKGFDFENAKTEIITAPKHIRIGSKDYILVAEKSGKLNILSRQGNIRVPVTESINFSENEWFGHEGKFISTTADHRIIEIDQNGKVSTGTETLAENVRLVSNDENLVYLNENQLHINGATINLDFGLYTDPQIFEVGKNTYVGITDLQTSQVFIFDQDAQLLPGFPVYGTSEINISHANPDTKKELIVKGEDNEILIYEF
ncbi:hypothetical protein [Gramella sp. AN32]|uniref:Uncharacterized protein n=1 Tax=Christiangramia antarctica TaxID=2058158 RepID=A0ABW5X2R4_9FLAO|nr:hypothetical protein [Gramella sp. AN32]MCM4156603.1 hypothetical protein [Gramella sp. AN32]